MGFVTWAASVALLLGGAGVGGHGGAVSTGLADDSCRAAPTARPEELLRRAADAVGLGTTGVLRYGSVERSVQNFQSDRTYPPFFAAFDIVEAELDRATGAQHRTSRLVYPGTGPMPERRAAATRTAAFMARGDVLVPLPQLFGQLSRSRLLDPHAALADWIADGEAVRSVGECHYRDDWRPVVERSGPFGAERLYLDRESGFPVKLDRWVPHVTWGERHEETLWSTWQQFGAVMFPTSSFVVIDGEVEVERTVGDFEVVDGAPLPELPATEPMSADPWLTSYTAIEPDTVRVGPGTWVLAHPMYNGAMTVVGDTVYVLDATLSEDRARRDQEWARALFPGHAHVRVVVTDLAWPHIGGVRYWVSQGAEIVADDSAEGFLREVVERRWTRWPDALEGARPAGGFSFVPFSAFGSRPDAPIRLMPLQGIGSEGALVVHVADGDFLWAGDWVQDAERPTIYASDVLAAVTAAGVRPALVAAQHLALRDWAPVAALNGGH